MIASRRLRSSVMYLLLPLLVGCSGIAARMEDTIKQADELDRMCGEIQAGDLDPENDGKAFPIWSRLKQQLELVWLDMSDLCHFSCPGVQTEMLDRALIDLDELIHSLGSESQLPDFPTCTTNDTATNNLRQCARAILNYDKDVGEKLREVAAGLKDISDVLNRLQAELNTQAQDARQAAEACGRRIAVWQGALGKVRGNLGALLTRDDAEVLKQYFATRFTTKASERFLNRLERQVAPIDHLLDKLDDKTYLVSSVMMTLAHNDIAKLVEKAYEDFLGRVSVPRTIRFTLAKASCARLERVPVAGERYSQVMPFLYEAFVKFGKQSSDSFLPNVPRKEAEKQTSVNDQRRSSTKMEDAGAQKGIRGTSLTTLALAKGLAIGDPTASSTQADPGSPPEKGSASAAEGLDKGGTPVSASVISKCLTATADTLQDRLKCARSSIQEARATLPESEQYKVLATAEFQARKALTQADGRVDENLVAQAGQLALGESVLSYQAAYAAGLGKQKPNDFEPANYAKSVTATVAHNGKTLLDMHQLVQFVTSHSDNRSVLNDNRVTIYRDSHNISHVSGQGSTPASPAPEDRLCPALLRLYPRLNCLFAGNRYAIELDTPFATRRWSDPAAYQRLMTIATTVRSMNKTMSLEVEGFASSSDIRPSGILPRLAPIDSEIDLSRWPQPTKPGEVVLQAHCPHGLSFTAKRNSEACKGLGAANDGNSTLALARAAWTAQVLSRWADGAVRVSSVSTLAADKAESGNLAADRKVRIRLTETK